MRSVQLGGHLGRLHLSVVTIDVNISVCKLLFEQVFSFFGVQPGAGVPGHAASRTASCLRSCTILQAHGERFLHVCSNTHFLPLKLVILVGVKRYLTALRICIMTSDDNRLLMRLSFVSLSWTSTYILCTFLTGSSFWY